MNSFDRREILNLLGIARKSGNISSGAEAVMDSLKKSRAKLLVMSDDITEKHKETMLKLCKKNSIIYLVFGSRDELGNAIGQGPRVALTVNNAGIAESVSGRIKKLFETESLGVDEWQK